MLLYFGLFLNLDSLFHQRKETRKEREKKRLRGKKKRKWRKERKNKRMRRREQNKGKQMNPSKNLEDRRGRYGMGEAGWVVTNTGKTFAEQPGLTKVRAGFDSLSPS